MSGSAKAAALHYGICIVESSLLEVASSDLGSEDFLYVLLLQSADILLIVTFGLLVGKNKQRQISYSFYLHPKAAVDSDVLISIKNVLTAHVQIASVL